MEKKCALVFSCNNRYYGIDAAMVQEIMFQHYVVAQSHVEAPFIATAKINGRMVPIICSEQRLGFAKDNKKSCVGNVLLLSAMVNAKKQLFGLVVGGVEGQLHYDMNEVGVQSHDRFDVTNAGWMLGWIEHEGMRVCLLDTRKFLGLDQLETQNVDVAACVA